MTTPRKLLPAPVERPAPPALSVASADWHPAWVSALEELELDLDAAEALLEEVRHGQEAPVANPWRPPTGIGPLPLDLTPRADAILSRQLLVAAAIAAGISHNRRQATLTTRLEHGGETARPSYLDCAM